MTAGLKIVFAGTPEISKTVLENILSSGFTVDLVLTQPDRPKGRGQKLTMSPVKQLAMEHAIEVLQPQSFKLEPEAMDKIRQLNPDIMVVVAYGLILPQALLDIPRLGCVNIHVSLLPRHRGAAPINQAILDGDNTTGVTIMQMDSGLDTGAILLQQEIAIAADETAGTLHDKLSELGAKMIVEYLKSHDKIEAVKQGSEGVTYAHKINKADAQICWNEPAEIIARKIRAYNPAPGCFTYLDEVLVKVWKAAVRSVAPVSVAAGTIIDTSNGAIRVACGNGTTVLEILELQSAGKTRQSAVEYLRGHTNLSGKCFGNKQ